MNATLLLVALHLAFVHLSVALEICTADYCAQFGAQNVCKFIDGSQSSVFTCAKFAQTEQSREQCSFACIQICLPAGEQPLGSDGNRYCSQCILKSASCASDYNIFFAPTGEPTTSPVYPLLPKCSLSFCSQNGSKGQCSLQIGATTKRITCGKWPSLDNDACPRAICKTLCRLPEKGRICNNTCPDCAFHSFSCESNFELYAPKKCSSPTPKPIVQTCSLELCSTNGSRAVCKFRGSKITCEQWPSLYKGACPLIVCLILCDLPPSGPVCNNTCPPCAFYAASCKTQFRLFAPTVCPAGDITLM